MRRSLTWLFALPLVLAGSQVAHVLAYRWVYPSSHVRLHALLSTGHGYMDQLPVVFGIGAAIAVASLMATVVDVARGRSLHQLPAWAFALLPTLTFVVQEILERSLHTGSSGRQWNRRRSYRGLHFSCRSAPSRSWSHGCCSARRRRSVG